MNLRFEADIDATPERVFDLIADLRAYHTWLPHSDAFNGTTDTEPSSAGIRRGTVVAFERPTCIAFDQPMTSPIAALGVIGIGVRFTLTPYDGYVRVLRELALTPTGIVKAFLPLLRGPLVRENERALAALTAAAEDAR